MGGKKKKCLEEDEFYKQKNGKGFAAVSQYKMLRCGSHVWEGSRH